jgi:hypothetical protein
MQGLRKTLLCGDETLSATAGRRLNDALTPVPTSTHSTSMVHQRELKELISELRIHFDRVREKAAWRGLKRGELRPDDFTSQSMFMDAGNELRLEQSLLAGHAFMVQELATKKNLTLDRTSQRLLQEILAYSRNLPPTS